MPTNVRGVALFCLLAAPIGCGRDGQRSADPRQVVGSPSQDLPGLDNVHRITDKLISGSSPEGDAGFQTLQKLGVRTVLSVDGARPDLERAHAHGLRYVHLPIGYDGICREQALRIAKAVRDLPGPVYLHCHHGKHRGPAAAVVVQLCLDDNCTVEAAFAQMKRAGTDPRYTGLYAAPKELQRPTPGELDRLATEFPEIASVTALAQVMVEIDERWERLKLVRTTGWKVPKDHPDIDPAHEARQLAEQYREAQRFPAVKERSEEFRRWLADAELSAGTLENALGKGGALDATKAEAAFRESGGACSKCHAKHRDVPSKP